MKLWGFLPLGNVPSNFANYRAISEDIQYHVSEDTNYRWKLEFYDVFRLLEAKSIARQNANISVKNHSY